MATRKRIAPNPNQPLGDPPATPSAPAGSVVEIASFQHLDQYCRQVSKPVFKLLHPGADGQLTEQFVAVPCRLLAPYEENWVRLQLEKALPKIVKGDDGVPRAVLDDPEYILRRNQAEQRARALAVVLGCPLYAEADATLVERLKACDQFAGPPDALLDEAVALVQRTFTEQIVAALYAHVAPSDRHTAAALATGVF